MRTYVYLKKQKREFNSRPKSEFPWNRHSLTILRSTYLNRRFVPRVDNSNPVSLLADRSIISPSLFALASRASASSKSRGSRCWEESRNRGTGASFMNAHKSPHQAPAGPRIHPPWGLEIVGRVSPLQRVERGREGWSAHKWGSLIPIIQ